MLNLDQARGLVKVFLLCRIFQNHHQSHQGKYYVYVARRPTNTSVSND
jgi:hypothetical protein